MISKDLAKLFQALFPRLVVEKWGPVKGSRIPTIRVTTTEKQCYIFEYLDSSSWRVTRCRPGFKNALPNAE